MSGTLKPCSICGAPGVQMWDAEENIIRCSSSGVCHNALYGMYFNEWQSRPLEDAFRDALEKVSSALRREIEKSKLLDTAGLRQYERAQNAENANATLRADLIEMRIKVDQLCDALKWIANSDGERNYTTGEGHSNCIYKARATLEEKCVRYNSSHGSSREA